MLVKCRTLPCISDTIHKVKLFLLSTEHPTIIEMTASQTETSGGVSTVPVQKTADTVTSLDTTTPVEGATAEAGAAAAGNVSN